MAVLRSFAVALLWLAFSCHAETYTGKVVDVADGDTVAVLDQDNLCKQSRHLLRNGILYISLEGLFVKEGDQRAFVGQPFSGQANID